MFDTIGISVKFSIKCLYLFLFFEHRPSLHPVDFLRKRLLNLFKRPPFCISSFGLLTELYTLYITLRIIYFFKSYRRCFSDSSPVVLLILLAELSGHFFYAFGHQTTFSSIPWDAAFVGVPGNFAYQFVQATLVVLHIGSSQLLAAFVIPLAVVWHLYRNKLGFLSFKNDKTDKKTTNVITDEDTELKLASNPDKLLENLAYYDLIYLSALAVKLLSIVVASALHRRHLMVWKIFAPKFIFEGVLFLVACCSIVVQYLLICRFCVSLKRFLKKFG